MFLSTPPPPMPLGLLGDPSQGSTHKSPPSRVCRPRSLGVLGKDLWKIPLSPFLGPTGWDQGKRPGSDLFSHCSLSVSECTLASLVFLPVHWGGQPMC